MRGASAATFFATDPSRIRTAAALPQLLRPLRRRRALVVRPHARRQVGVEVLPPQQRRVPVHVPPREGVELRQQASVLRQHAREVHHLRQPQRRRVRQVRQQVPDLEPCPGRLQLRRRHAGAEVHLQRHHERQRRVQEVAQPRHAQDVRDLVRVADRRRRPARQHALLERVRQDQRALDVQVRVDQPRRQHPAPRLDLAPPAIRPVRADDRVAAHRHVPRLVDRPGRRVEDARVLDREVRRLAAEPLVDAAGELARGHATPSQDVLPLSMQQRTAPI